MKRMKHPHISQIELSDLMNALSDPTRLEIIRRLAKVARPMNCQELDLDRPKSSMSHHFKILREAGLVETVVNGTEHLNTLRIKDLESRFPGLLKAILKTM